MKQFKEEDLLINKVKTYPSVKLFTYSGKTYVNNEGVQNVTINDFLLRRIENAIIVEVDGQTYFLITEYGDLLYTEDGR